MLLPVFASLKREPELPLVKLRAVPDAPARRIPRERVADHARAVGKQRLVIIVCRRIRPHSVG